MLLELNQKNAIVAALRAIAQQNWGTPLSRPNWAHDVMTANDNDTSLDNSGILALAEQFKDPSQDVCIGPKLPNNRPGNGCGKYTYSLKDNEYHIHSPRGDFICKAPHHILAAEICDALDLAAKQAIPQPPQSPKTLEHGGFIEAKRNVLLPWYSEVGCEVGEQAMKEGERLACAWATPAVLIKRDDRHFVARPDEILLVPPTEPALKVEPGDDPTGEES